SAAPGLQITSLPDQIVLPEPACRARLVPWREYLYPLGQPRADALRHVVHALSGVPGGVVQIVVSPDTSWQRAAAGRLDDLAGIPRRQPLPLRLLSDALGIVFDVVWSGGAKPSKQPARSHADTQPPPDKAGRLGYRTEVRLRVSA